MRVHGYWSICIFKSTTRSLVEGYTCLRSFEFRFGVFVYSELRCHWLHGRFTKTRYWSINCLLNGAQSAGGWSNWISFVLILRFRVSEILMAYCSCKQFSSSKWALCLRISQVWWAFQILLKLLVFTIWVIIIGFKNLIFRKLKLIRKLLDPRSLYFSLYSHLLCDVLNKNGIRLISILTNIFFNF